MSRKISQAFAVRGKDFLEGGRVSTEIKNMLRELGVAPEIVRRIAIATYEAEMNIVMYADEATITVELTSHAVRVVAQDRGPGIPDIALAMQEGYSTATPEMREMGFGAGMGLPNIKKNADRFAISSTAGRGTMLEFTIEIH
jgi:serine/threonine-protein kinase RsbT